jgi:hypothetical protein
VTGEKLPASIVFCDHVIRARARARAGEQSLLIKLISRIN